MAKRRRRADTTLKSSPVSTTPSSEKLGAWLTTHRVQLAQALLIIACSLWIYWPALNGGFIWDDTWYIVLNPLLHDWTGLFKIWFAPGSWVEYYPINQTLFWIEYQLWGENTLGYHLVSLLFHVISALLVWRLLSQFGLRLAWLGGLLFAINPVQVPSVAWICELKNTASLPPALLAMSAWIEFEKHQRLRDYRLSLLFYVISMLGKITMAPFPFVMLIYAWWRRDRIGMNDLKRIGPFLLVALTLVAATKYGATIYSAGSYTQDVLIPTGDPITCLVRAGVLWWFYLGVSLFPANTSPLYPRWIISSHDFAAWLPLLALLILAIWCWVRRASWGRHALLGFGFFGLNLLPFLGLVGISYMVISWVEMHLLYLPVIAVIGLTIAFVEGLSQKLPTPVRFLPVAGTAAAMVALLAAARSCAGWYTSEEVFWTRTIQRVPGAWLGYVDLGCHFIHEKRYDEAIRYFRDGIAIEPNYGFSYYNLGIALEKSGQLDQALAAYREAIRLNPKNPDSYLYLAEALRYEGKVDEAEQVSREGLTHAPDSVDLNINLANILFERGQVTESIELYQRAEKANADSAQLQYNYGMALMKSGNLAAAAEHFSKAVALDPQMAVAHQSLGAVLAQSGNVQDAIREFEAAIAEKPDYVDAHSNLARALVQSGRIDDAIEQFKQVLIYDPNNSQAQQNLARLQQYEQQHPAKGAAK